MNYNQHRHCGNAEGIIRNPMVFFIALPIQLIVNSSRSTLKWARFQATVVAGQIGDLHLSGLSASTFLTEVLVFELGESLEMSLDAGSESGMTK